MLDGKSVYLRFVLSYFRLDRSFECHTYLSGHGKDTYSERLLHRASVRAAPVWLETGKAVEIEGLKRKLTSKLGANSPSLQPDWKIGELVNVWLSGSDQTLKLLCILIVLHILQNPSQIIQVLRFTMWKLSRMSS